jgi:hypothetical protein
MFCLSARIFYLSTSHLSICSSVYLSLWLLYPCLFVSLSICLSIYLSICFFAYLNLCLPVYLCLSVSLSTCFYVSLSLSICLSVRQSSYLSIHLLVYLSICPGNKSKHRSIYLWIPLILLIVQPRGEYIMSGNFGLDIILIIPAVVSSVEPQDSSSK